MPHLTNAIICPYGAGYLQKPLQTPLAVNRPVFTLFAPLGHFPARTQLVILYVKDFLLVSNILFGLDI